MNTKRIVIVTAAIILAALVAYGLWLSFGPEETVPPEPGPGTLPIASSSTLPTPEAADIGPDFMAQASGDRERIVLGTMTVVSGYALQEWTDENRGGQALLRFSASQDRWLLLSMGGGAWSAEGLVTFSVPADVAARLVAGAS